MPFNRSARDGWLSTIIALTRAVPVAFVQLATARTARVAILPEIRTLGAVTALHAADGTILRRNCHHILLEASQSLEGGLDGLHSISLRSE